jgi:hypothetical protein
MAEGDNYLFITLDLLSRAEKEAAHEFLSSYLFVHLNVTEGAGFCDPLHSLDQSGVLNCKRGNRGLAGEGTP